MTIQVSDLRVAVIYMAPFDGFPDRDPIVVYEKNFLLSCQGKGIWQPPWSGSPKIRSHFWERYVETGPDLSLLTPERAWKYLVPLRTRLATCKADWLAPGWAYVEGIRYPHAVAIVVWLIFRSEPLDLTHLVENAVAAYRDNLYNIKWDIGGGTSSLNLTTLAQSALGQFRRAVLGDLPVPARQLDPFTIATVVNGTSDNIDDNQPVQGGGEIHRALEGLCSWERNWYDHPIHPLQPPYSLKMGATEPNNHIFYGLHRARAGWFPTMFANAEKVQRSLGCYHRNLTYATLQTEGLIEFVRLYDRFLQDNIGLPLSLRTAAVNAINALRRLCFGSKESTYRSWSVRLQIEDQRELLDKVSERLTDKKFEWVYSPAGKP